MPGTVNVEQRTVTVRSRKSLFDLAKNAAHSINEHSKRGFRFVALGRRTVAGAELHFRRDGGVCPGHLQALKFTRGNGSREAFKRNLQKTGRKPFRALYSRDNWTIYLVERL